VEGERTAKEARRSILVIDDDAVFRIRLVQALHARGFDARGAASVDSALAAARSESPELAIVDLRLAGASGLDLVRELKAIDEATSIVVLTGYGSIATALEAVRLGATHYLTKPADVDEILAAFERRTAPPAALSSHRDHEVASLARAEWEHIHRVLTDCGGNVSLAARQLGIHRRSLQRKLSKYPVSR
jgi:two-component system, response regulator RegA